MGGIPHGELGGDAHLAEKGLGALDPLIPCRRLAPSFHRLGDDARHTPARVESRLGILEHHLNGRNPDLPGVRGAVGHVLAIEHDAARRRRLQPEQQLGKRALAAAAFTDESDELVRGDAKLRIANGADFGRAPKHVARSDVALVQILDLEQGPAGDYTGNRAGQGRLCNNLQRDLGADAGCPMVRRVADNRRLTLEALLGRDGTAWGKATTGHARQLPQARHLLRQKIKCPPLRAHGRIGELQATRIGVSGRRENRPRRPIFDRAAGIHHHDLVAQMGRKPQIVRDENECRGVLLLHLCDQFYDVRLDGEIKRGGRLIRNHKPRIARKRHCDQYALAHPA